MEENDYNAMKEAAYRECTARCASNPGCRLHSGAGSAALAVRLQEEEAAAGPEAHGPEGRRRPGE